MQGVLRDNLVELWTFAGTRMNRLVANLLDPGGENSSFNHRAVILKGAFTADEVAEKWKVATAAVEAGAMLNPTEQQSEALKFFEAVPAELRRASISRRLAPQSRPGCFTGELTFTAP
jgi:hypothetical protein